MPRTMTPDERQAFLADVHVGVIAVAHPDGRGPLVTPIWYSYEPGGKVQFMTLPESRKAQLIQSTGRASLCVQEESVPYRYVAVEGPVAGGEAPAGEWGRAVNRRYLGPELGDQIYESTLETLGPEVLFELTPQRWTSSDYSEDFGG
jgi:hypothetical protein